MLKYKKIKSYLLIITACFFSTSMTASVREGDDGILYYKRSKKVVQDRDRDREHHHHRRDRGTELLEEVLDGKTRCSDSITESRKKVKTVRILEIDGGAMRGVMPATVLEKIEEETGQAIADIFHMVGGNSIGCVLTTGLTLPSLSDPHKPRWSAKQLAKMLKTETPKIFRWRLPIWSIYDTGALEALAEKTCGNITFDQSIIPTVGVTFDCLAAKSKFICSWETEEIFRTQDVVLASSAVPLVFYPRILYPVNFNAPNRRYLVADGFIGCNNPTAILVSKAKKLFPNADSCEIVSLGNGIIKDPMYYKLIKGGLALSNYALRIFDIGLNAVSSEPDEYAKYLISGNYTRINPIVSQGGGPFDASSQNMASLENDTENYLEENKAEFDALIKRLRKPKD